jgi:hypothetical protein
MRIAMVIFMGSPERHVLYSKRLSEVLQQQRLVSERYPHLSTYELSQNCLDKIIYWRHQIYYIIVRLQYL